MGVPIKLGTSDRRDALKRTRGPRVWDGAGYRRKSEEKARGNAARIEREITPPARHERGSGSLTEQAWQAEASGIIDIFANDFEMRHGPRVASADGAIRSRQEVINLDDPTYRLVMTTLTVISVAVAIAALHQRR